MIEAVVAIAVISGFVLLVAWLGRPHSPSAIGTGRDPKPEETVKDSPRKPSKFTGGYGPYGGGF